MNEIVSANPFTQDAIDQLDLTDAEADLRAAIMASEPRPARAVPRPRARMVSRRRIGVVMAAAAVALAFALASEKSASNGGTAYAAGLVHFANNSPLLLLRLDGWHVADADEESAAVGELQFLRGTAPLPPQVYDMTGDQPTLPPIEQRQRQAQLTWRTGAIDDWIRDRAASAKVQSTTALLGTTARVFQYDGGAPGDRDITALWTYNGRVLEYRAQVPDMAAFERQLAALTPVDADAWLDAMPSSVVKASQRPSAVGVMLRGIPLPPGFDPQRDIPGSQLTRSSYQLGTTVTAAVACRWMERWSDGRRTGDAAKADEAIRAMSTAPTWPVLREMEKDGDWSSVVVGYAKAMPSGTWFGRPLEGDVQEGLGCSSVGVTLENP